MNLKFEVIADEYILRPQVQVGVTCFRVQCIQTLTNLGEECFEMDFTLESLIYINQSQEVAIGAKFRTEITGIVLFNIIVQKLWRNLEATIIAD